MESHQRRAVILHAQIETYAKQDQRGDTQDQVPGADCLRRRRGNSRPIEKAWNRGQNRAQDAGGDQKLRDQNQTAVAAEVEDQIRDYRCGPQGDWIMHQHRMNGCSGEARSSFHRLLL